MKKIISYLKKIDYSLIIFVIVIGCGFILFDIFVSEKTKELVEYIFAIFGITLISLLTICIIYGIIRKHINKKKIKFVNKVEFDIVRNYYKKCVFDKLNKDNEEYDLYDAFETVRDNCRYFLNMDKKCIPKNELFLKEDTALIKKINSKNLNRIYEETNQVLDIIYKYYSEDGIRKI